MENEQDLRVRKTKRLLKETLEVMLEDQMLEEIRVTELCQKAEINKSTFYRHYHDIFALYQKSLTDFFEATLANVDFSFLFSDPDRFFSALLEAAGQDLSKFKRIHLSNMAYYYNDLFEQILTRHVYKTGLVGETPENQIRLSMIFGTMLKFMPLFPEGMINGILADTARQLYPPEALKNKIRS